MQTYCTIQQYALVVEIDQSYWSLNTCAFFAFAGNNGISNYFVAIKRIVHLHTLLPYVPCHFVRLGHTIFCFGCFYHCLLLYGCSFAYSCFFFSFCWIIIPHSCYFESLLVLCDDIVRAWKIQILYYIRFAYTSLWN